MHVRENIEFVPSHCPVLIFFNMLCILRVKAERERMSLAAQKIQEVYRKKREAKEKAKLMDVPQPRVLMKYSGHRNCRTMVSSSSSDLISSGGL